MARRPTVPEQLKTAPFTFQEAQRFGLSRRQLESQAWCRVGGLFAWSGLEITPRVILGAIHRRLPAGSAFSHLTAGWLHRLDLNPINPVEVTVPLTSGITRLAGVKVHRRHLTESVRLKGLPATDALRTTCDIASRLSLVEAVVIIDMALHLALFNTSGLASYLTTVRGARHLRAALDLAEPMTESPMETRLRLLLVLAGLPRPVAQFTLRDQRDRFLGRPDLYYPQARLALEYDGSIHRDSLVSDNRRQNRLVNAGYRLLRFTAPDLDTPGTVVSQVRAALSAAPSNILP